MKRYLFGANLGVLLYFSVAPLFAAPVETNSTSNSIPTRLGWISTSAAENICCGYYFDPLADFGNKPLSPLATTPININAESGTLKLFGKSLLIGKVSLAQPGRLASADRLLITRDDNNTPVTADLIGNVTLREPGKLLIGDSAHMALHSKAASFMHALYRMVIGTPPSSNASAKSKSVLTAWGKADTMQQNDQGIIHLSQASYTTCAPTTKSWRVHAEKLILNHDTGRGYAYNTWLTVDDVPVFYTPYFNFPIDDRRQSGFLFPTFGTSTTAGFNFTLPYYWNIAPNYDALITPHIYLKRGLQMNSDVRYLTNSSAGDISASYLPHDPVFKNFKDKAAVNYAGNPALGRLLNTSDNRSAFTWHDISHFNEHWHSTINYNTVSDDYYLQDFADVNSTAHNQLLQSASINYAGDNWIFNGIVQGYQTLHPVNQAAVANPYSDLPQINWNGDYPDEALGLTYQFDNQFTYFARSPNPGETTAVPRAARINIQPGISLPLTSSAGFITPDLQLAMTHYNITSQVNGFKNQIQRNIPIFNIDSGVYFDRNTILWHTAYEQTLEPRLFYLYVPYHNQDAIPLFDTGIVPFSYDSLFMNNRFSGLDRIGDANQLAYALTTRFLDANDGAEKFRASIGQIYYFHNRRVALCQASAAAGSTPSTASNYGACSNNPLIAVGAISSTEKFSPIAGQMAYHFNPAWSASANAAWDPASDETVNAGAAVHYNPAVNHVLNLNYNYIRFGDAAPTLPNQAPVSPSSHENDLNQAGVSMAWPFNERWSAVGGYTYNISHRYPQTYFYGLQYGSCCWAVRLVAGRMFSNLNQNNNPTFNNTVYLQWQLKGLADVGTDDPSSFLLNSIPGYQDNFQPFQGSSL